MLLTREQLQERLLALYRASLELVKDSSLEQLLEQIAKVACEQAGAEYAALGVLDDHGKLVNFITVGMTDAQIKRMDHPPVGRGLLGELMDTEDPLRVPVIQDHPKSVGFPKYHPSMIPFLGVPIRAGDRQFGQIYLTNKIGAREFDENDEMIIQMLASYASVAIQNARLHEAARRLAVLEERNRIGMDLHDGIIQSIYGVGLALESAQHALNDPDTVKERIQHAIVGLNQAIRDIRTYILDLRPRQLGNEGLLNGIKRLIAEYRANTFVEVGFTGPDSDLKELPHSHSTVLFHICQEALANIAKHAKAKNIQVAILTTDERVLMEITDDGKGFDIDKTQSSIGHGLANMSTRARSVGGDLDISSHIGEGTTLLVWVPRAIRS